MPVAKLKCKCHKEYQPRESLIKTPKGLFCSYGLAIEWANEQTSKRIKRENAKVKQVAVKKVKAFNRETKRLKESIKSSGEYIKEAQSSVNKYIRLRDRNKPCVSCGSNPAQIRGGTFDAGHYRSRGSASHLRFNLLNIHKQCVKCNRFNSGNAVDYRIELIRRIGEDNVIKLENDNRPRKFTIEYLKRVKTIFNKRSRFYENLN